MAIVDVDADAAPGTLSSNNRQCIKMSHSSAAISNTQIPMKATTRPLSFFIPLPGPATTPVACEDESAPTYSYQQEAQGKQNN